jgi:invasion protein IalB
VNSGTPEGNGKGSRDTKGRKERPLFLVPNFRSQNDSEKSTVVPASFSTNADRASRWKEFMRNLRLALTNVLASAALLAATCGAACAQERTTATYVDWVLQCATEAGPSPKKACEIVQVSQVQGKNIPFSRIAIDQPVKGRPVKLTIQVPVSVSLRSQVDILPNDTDSAISAPFDRCTPAGCFVEFELKDEILKKLYAIDGVGKVTFKDAGGGAIALPLSFKGFRQAFDALSKQ